MPYKIVERFEETIAEYAGAKYGVAVESGTAAIFLSCFYCNVGEVSIPKRTYPSVPCSIIHAGGRVLFTDLAWEGIYGLAPYLIWDGALRFRQGMYTSGLYCLSFHAKKHLKIGRGGMILTDDKDAADWLRLARFDGREACDLSGQKEFNVLGWNAYMEPEHAARGLLLFSSIKQRDLPDLSVEEQCYPDLSLSPIYSGITSVLYD
jgi:dTDP-4-amino-4,6-dideoxygalactose transaminase